MVKISADIDAISGIQDSFRTPLIMAAAQNRTGMLALLIANGADLFCFDSEGHSALQLAQMQGNDSCAHIIISAIERLHREIKIKNQVIFRQVYLTNIFRDFVPPALMEICQ